MNKVLLIDDEERMLELLTLYLKPYPYFCRKAVGAKEGLKFFKEEKFDLILLDIMMPEMNGWEVCREIRQYSDVPIIMVTAREQKEDIVKGLKLGADDYITKHFDEVELVARMDTVLRRKRNINCIEIEWLLMDEDQHKLSYKKKLVKLTPKEFAIIRLFMNNPGRVFSRNQVIDLVLNMDPDTEGRTVDSHV